MAAAMRCVISVALACCWLGAVFSFNLEPRIPIVKKGSPQSHFGYSVAQHQSFSANSAGVTSRKSWILVGAPKDDNLQPGTRRSGALYKCPLTTHTTDCVQVKTDGFRDINGDLSLPAEDEIKDGQWLGVTLKSQGPGGKVLVCAHRYRHKGPDFQWGFGLCYILTDNLDVADNLEPCRGKPVDKEHQQYGFCQAGTSGLLLEDEAVLGVPGPFTWRGTVHTSNISDDYLLKDKTQYFGPVTEADSPVAKYSYLGYSVTAGRFFGNYMSYVGGAPRSQETGQVVFFTREKIGNSLLRVDLVLSGEKFASSFGYEVLALDINGDGRDDLVVSAPFYYTRKASGAIYVYMNNDGGFQENHKPTKIEGLGLAFDNDKFKAPQPLSAAEPSPSAPGESRFGASMTSLNDLNNDGYLDIAVGAPYDGRGAIYIFLGTSDGLSPKPAQIIRAEDVPGTPYNAFGYALSGGMDLDNNGYPDLLTSSFCSDRVLLLRARPIMDIETKVTSDGQLENIDPSRKGCRVDIMSPETCFWFEACFKMDNDAGSKTALRLHYTIKERPYQDRPLARVRFRSSTPDQLSEVHRNITLRPEDMGSFQCSRETVYLLEGPRDILRPLRFRMTYEIIQREPRPVSEGSPLPDINDYPILNQEGALRDFEGTFAKKCGDDDVCMSDLHMIGSLDLDHDVTGKHYILKLGDDEIVPLLVEVQNSEEPAYETTLLVNHNEALIFDPTESEVGIYQCSSPSSQVVKCGVGNPLVNTTGPLRLSFKESGKAFESKFVYFSVLANSSSTELTPQEPLHFQVEVVKKAEIFIKGDATPEQVFYGGEVVGESAIKHFEEIGKEVTHKYVVQNMGPWRVDELQVEVQWPYQVENGKEKGKWLLYMTEYPTLDGVGECEIDPSYVNPLNMRRSKIYPDTHTGHKVDLEVESTDAHKPTTEDPVIAGGVTTFKNTTIKKTTNTTIKKISTKTSSEKTSTGSTSSSSSSFSSSGGYSSSSSHSSYDGYDDNIEDRGHDEHSGRVHGRTHSRVSRRVFSSSDRARFDENNLGGETTKDDTDDDGRVITHYERTHHSSGKSPDGKSSFQETRHESKKVTVSENTNIGNVPSSRWGQGGGYRHTYTENHSSSRTSDGEPEETHTRWETHQTLPRGQDSENQWGDSDSTHISGRREESWRERSRTHTVDSSTRKTQSGQLGEDSYQRTHEGGAVTSTFGHDSYLTDGDSKRTWGQDNTGDRRKFDWSDQTERTPYNREAESRNREGNYHEERRHQTDISSRGRTESGSYPGSDGYASRRVASSSQWSHRSSSNQGFDDDRLTGAHDYRDPEGGYDDRYSSSQGHRSHQGRYDEDRATGTYSRSFDRTRGRDDYRRHEGDDWQQRGHRRYDQEYSGRDETQGENYGSFDNSYGDSGRHRSHSESRTSSWHSHSSSGYGSRDGLHQDVDDNYERRHAGASSERRHIESDGSVINGTYTRVDVDPRTGKTTTYTRKAVYNSWPIDSDQGWVAEEQELSSNQRSARTKREKELIIKPQAVTDASGKTMQVVHLGCDPPATAKCFTFRCNIRNLIAGRSASIHIKSRLWNATLVEDYPRVSSVSIKSRAQLILPKDIREDQNQEDDVDWAETQAYPDLLDQLPPEEVPLWVILVSIFAGLLVLIIIALILWKLGFFERKRPDPTLSGNLDKDANGY